jgi:hypothetical protein
MDDKPVHIVSYEDRGVWWVMVLVGYQAVALLAPSDAKDTAFVLLGGVRDERSIAAKAAGRIFAEVGAVLAVDIAKRIDQMAYIAEQNNKALVGAV